MKHFLLRQIGAFALQLASTQAEKLKIYSSITAKGNELRKQSLVLQNNIN